MKRVLVAVLMAVMLLPVGGAMAAKGGNPDKGGKPDGPNQGVCNAYFKGSERGQEQKHAHGKAFQELEAAAEAAGVSVDEFCFGPATPPPPPPPSCAAGFGDGSGLPVLTDPGTVLNADRSEDGTISGPVAENLEPLDPTEGLISDEGVVHEVNCTAVITVEDLTGI